MNRTPPDNEFLAVPPHVLRSPPAQDWRQPTPKPPRSHPRARHFSLAWRRLRWWHEILVVGIGYLLYEVVQGAAPEHHEAPFSNARRLITLESKLHIDVERPINHFINHYPALATLTGYYYDSMHYLITPLMLTWLCLRRPASYARWRSALVLASIAALAVYWLWPLAPPRLAMSGITDTLVTRDVLGTTVAGGSGSLVNQFAAMPSLHVGWAIWCAFAIVDTTKTRWRYLAWLYPVATTVVVLGTGNHYLLDGVGGLAFILLGLGVTTMNTEQLSR